MLPPTGNGTHPRTRPKISRAFSQAKRLQELLMADAETPDLKPLIRAGIARAFCELEETKRKLQMRPLPKPIDTEALKRRKEKKGSSSGLSE
jgi:hypothetical protein